GSAGQHDGVNSFHGLCRIEESSLARAGPATAHVYARGHGLIEDDHRNTGAKLGVPGVPHTNARDVGDQVARHVASGGDTLTSVPVPAKQPQDTCMKTRCAALEFSCMAKYPSWPLWSPDLSASYPPACCRWSRLILFF